MAAEKNRQSLEFLRSSKESKERGYIVEVNGEGENEIVCALPKLAYEYEEYQYKELPVGPNQKYSRVIEGRLILVFFHNDKWHVSATNKINAFEAFDSAGKSLGEKFRRRFLLKVKRSELFEAFDELLNKNYTYTFISPIDPKERFVCVYEEDEPPVFVNVTDKEGEEMENEDIGEGMRPQMLTIEDHEVLKKTIEEVNIKKNAGLITKLEETGEYLKIYPESYSFYYFLKSCPNNLTLSYLQQRLRGPSIIDSFKDNWPELLDYAGIEKAIRHTKNFFTELQMKVESYSQGHIVAFFEKRFPKKKLQRAHLDAISDALKRSVQRRRREPWRLEKDTRTLWVLMKIIGNQD